MKWKLLQSNFITAVFFLFLGSVLFAGTTGKIAGFVVDKESGEPLPGVNIILEGTFLGASTDLDGQYAIINIPPGTYTVRAEFVGYESQVVRDVNISIDLTTRIDFSLNPTFVQGEVIEIEAKKEIIQKDLTGTMSTVQSEDIDAMPVQSIDQVINLQAGVISSEDGIHIRGGRGRETKYLVDGISVTALDGQKGINVETDAVQEMQLISGTFNAEYGQAMSGIINIVTKEGGSSYSGQVQGVVGSYYSSSSIFGVMTDYGPYTDPKTGRTRMVDETTKPLEQIRPESDLRATFSGPFPFTNDKVSFFINGRYEKTNGYLYGNNWYTPQGLPGDSSLVPLNPKLYYALQGKLTFYISPTLKVNYNFLYNRTERDHNTSLAYRYVPFSGKQQYRTAVTHMLSLNQTLSNSTFYELKLSNYESNFESYLYDNPSLTPGYFIRIYKNVDGEDVIEDRYYSSESERLAIENEAKENSWKFEYIVDPARARGFLHPDSNIYRGIQASQRRIQTPLDFEYSSNKFWLFRFDITSQLSFHHLIKAGGQAIFHEINRNQFTLRPKTDDNGNEIVPFRPTIEPISSLWHNKYTRTPREFSAYIQDKMEFDQLIINLGLRFDYFDANHVIPVDPRDPDVYNPVNPEWKGPDWDEEYYQSLPDEQQRKEYEQAHSYTTEERRALMYKKVNPKIQVSPRIGIAYPISEKGVIHFSYGHFFQMPDARYLYGIRPDYKLSVGDQYQLFGNPDLEAEKTVQYELGLQSQIGQSIGLDITVFYKDIRDWVGISPLVDTKHSQTTRYVQYENKDYANVRGITVAFEGRMSNNFLATLDYTFQIAEGTYSDPRDAYAALQGNQEPAKQLIFMDYDRRNVINGTLTYRISGWVMSLIGKFNTGFPYTPQKAAGTPAANYRGWTENIARRPSTSQLDLRVDKTVFTTGKLIHKLYLRVYNLLDQRGELNVYTDTGTARYTTSGTHTLNPYNPSRIGSVEHYYLRPNWYQAPRQIQLGYIISF